ncbi:MAG: hypothetical protein Q9218_005750 [Villophora microphyllina]
MSPETLVGIIFGTFNVFLATLALLQARKYTQKADALLRASSARHNGDIRVYGCYYVTTSIIITHSLEEGYIWMVISSEFPVELVVGLQV